MTDWLTRDNVLRTVAVLLTGFLLAAGFPPMSDWEAAWVALAPLLVLAVLSRPGQAMRWGFWAGLLFWLATLTWLLRLCYTGGSVLAVVPAWVALAAYCALYMGFFAGVVAWWARRLDVRGQGGERGAVSMALRRMGFVVTVPLFWVGWEYLRSTLFTGFSWNALGVSQFRNLAVLQLAEIGGVYLVSAVIVALNTALALVAVDLAPAHRGGSRRVRVELMLALLLVLASWMGGSRRMAAVDGAFADADILRVAAVQPNIPQDGKWADDTNSVVRIFDALEKQTLAAVRLRPDLIVWPETALPGALPLDQESDTFARELARQGAPILTGAMEARYGEGGRHVTFWNSAFLFDDAGRVAGTYRKVHLVPFGEYVPFDRFVPILERLAPLGVSCRPGTEHVVFRVGAQDAPVGTLICFEDSIPSLARAVVRRGAALLVNQTNDAWFDGSAGPLQHMSQCVLRCIENRVACVRSANTGITCAIGVTGRVQTLAPDEGGEPVSGFAVFGVSLRPASMGATVYSRYGDWIFAVPCAILCIAVVVVIGLGHRRRRIAGDAMERREHDG